MQTNKYAGEKKLFVEAGICAVNVMKLSIIILLLK